MRRLVLAAAMSCAFPVAAHGDGLPMVDFGVRPDAIDGPDARVMAVPAGRDTVVARVGRERGQVRGSRLLRGRLAIPAVAYDGTPGGLAADGSLALIEPRRAFPRERTRFVLLDKWLRVDERIDLEGDFSFDAISPDGTALFLVEYPNRKDPSVYRVRVYDVAAGRLLPKALIDSETAAIVMRGLPMTRATVGPREFTLYDGLGEPFVHALDTAKRSALCIPLPESATAGHQPYRLDLRPTGDTIEVRDRDETLAVVDTRTNSARPSYEDLGVWFGAFRGSPGSDPAPRL